MLNSTALPTNHPPAHTRALWVILALAFMLRLAFAFSQDPQAAYSTNADTWWYLDHGYKLVQGTVGGPPQSAPLFLILPGIAQQLLGADSAGAVILLWVVNILMGTATCYFVYRLAWALSGDEHAGLVAGALMAVSPVFVLETGQLLTETLYIFLVSAGLLAYITWITPPDTRTSEWSKYGGALIVGVILGLATLTRAVLLLFPLGLAIHLLLAFGLRDGLKRAAIMLVVYVLVCSTWTIYNLVRWDYPVIGAQGLSAFLFIGADGWKAPDQVDEQLQEVAEGQFSTNPEDQQELYQQAAAQAIGRDIPAYLARRVGDLADAFLQPHGTTFFGGESLKSLVVNWWANDRTLSGLLRVTEGDQFWPKLVIYLFYYGSVAAGIVGLWVSRRNWRVILPLAGFILYTLLLHFVLDALPRYLFPISVVWVVFAGVGLVALWHRLRGQQQIAPTLTSSSAIAPP